MKVYPWLDSIAAPVVGTKYALGEGCELLNELDGIIKQSPELSNVFNVISNLFNEDDKSRR